MRRNWLAFAVMIIAVPAAAEEASTPTQAPMPPVVAAPAEAKPAPLVLPVPADARPTTKLSTKPPTTEKVVFVPTGIERNINFLSQLNRDCSSMGSIEYRVLGQPEHGTVTFEAGENFSWYSNNLLQHCNDQKAPGLATRFKSAEGYVGEDQIDVLYLLPSAAALEIRYIVVVK